MPRDVRQSVLDEKLLEEWDFLISDSEKEIELCRDKIFSLRKSIAFFKKQKAERREFPLKKGASPHDLS